MTVILCGLGPGGAQGLTLGALEAMRAHPTYLRTERHESVQTLRAYGVAFESFDALYGTSADFDALCTQICQRIYAAAQEQDVVYAVPAGAGFADATVQALCAFLKERGVAVRALPGVGYGESAALAAGGLDGAVVISAQGLDARWINTRAPLVICEVDNRLLAGDVKVLLENWYPPQHRIRSVSGDKIAEFPLCELDRQGQYSHRLSIVVPPVDILALSRYDFTRLQEIAAILRGRSDRFEGCPWDMEQTHASMRACMIEEAYEAADYALRHGQDLQIPLFLAHGEEDPICAFEGSQSFWRECSGYCEFHGFPGCYHELHNEPLSLIHISWPNACLWP